MYMKNLLLIISFCLIKVICYSQDTIIAIPHDTISCVVHEINDEEIKYKPFDFQDGPLRTILKTSVYIIQYQNGKIDTINSSYSKRVPQAETPVSNRTKDYYVRGFEDAKKNYDGYEGAGTITLVTTVLFWPAGLVPAIICSSVPPKEKNMNYPSKAPLKKDDYLEGYKNGAKKKKQGKVWMNFGIGIGVNVVAIILLSSRR
jgi:hypothetical protein